MTRDSGRTLAIADVVKCYAAGEESVCVLNGVSLTLEPGEAVAVTGPSGSGKSTLLHIAGALDRPTSGSVRYGEIDVARLEGRALAEFRAHRVGFVFQDHHLLPQLTTLQNVLLPTIAAGSPEDATGRAQDLLERVGLAGRRDAYPSRMSGGERQRTAIARALVNGAGLILCDEPTGNLDAESGASVVSLLLDLAREGASVITVTHNLEHAGRFARRLDLRDGRLAEGAAG